MCNYLVAQKFLRIIFLKEKGETEVVKEASGKSWNDY